MRKLRDLWDGFGWLTKIVIIGIVIVPAFIYGRSFLYESGYLGKQVHDTKQLERADQGQNTILATAPKNYLTEGLKALSLPSERVLSGTPKLALEFWGMGWNAQLPLAYANGGVNTTEGSLFGNSGLQLKFVRQDDYGKMKDKMLAYAHEFKQNPSGTPMYLHAIMGDGMVTYAGDLEAKLKQIDPSFSAKGICVPGFSFGEDKFIGPYQWRLTPDSARGGICVVYPKDGDHNIAIKWGSDNNIPINPDFTTWDPDALNFVSADDFMDAGFKYMNRKSKMVELWEVKTNPKTGKSVRVGTKQVTKMINATSTWLPQDEKIFRSSEDDIVTILSTKENSQQMPCLIIGLKQHMDQNREQVEDFIWALMQAGDQVKTFSQALYFGAEVESKVYNAETGKYWGDYFKGIPFTTKFGRSVTLGGSRACNLMDNVEYFGLNGGPNRYEVVYKLFGSFMKNLYPDDVNNLPDVGELIDLSYLKDVYEKHKGNLSAPYEPAYASGTIIDKTSQRNWKIEFSSGHADLTQKGMETLRELYLSVGIHDLKIQIYGHTDNDGSEASNQILSDQRAIAVKAQLIRLGIKAERFTEVLGYGQSRPLPDVNGNTVDGKARNRRVEILTGI